MDVQPDKPHDTDWLSHAACAGSRPRITWHWTETPLEESAAPALSVCASCPVVAECRQEMADTGERYRYQVRGGLRMWVPDDVAQLPEPRLYERPDPPKRKPGRPADGFIKSTHLKDKIALSRDASDEYATPMQLHSHIPTNGQRSVPYPRQD